MAFPFVELPTFGDFRERLATEFSCSYHALKGAVASFAGDGPEPVYYLERQIDGSARRYRVQYGDDERLLPSEIRSICVHLDIDPAVFGVAMAHYLTTYDDQE